MVGRLSLKSPLYSFPQKRELAFLKLVYSAFSVNESHSSFKLSDLLFLYLPTKEEEEEENEKEDEEEAGLGDLS